MKKQVTTEIRLTKEDIKDILIKALGLDAKTVSVYFNTTMDYGPFDQGRGSPAFVDVSVKTTQDLEF